MINSPFEPIYGLNDQINRLPITNGRLYFSTDTGKIYLDINDKRHIMGGAGITLYYAEQSEVDQNNDDYYLLQKENFLNNADPKKDDLILNILDGSFYRVEFINNNIYLCTQLAVSGTGTGGSTLVKDLTLTYNSSTIDINYSYIYGQDYYLEFTGTSTVDSKVNFAVTISQNDKIISQTSYQRSSGELFKFNAALLPKGNNISITVTLSSPNTEMTRLPTKYFTGISTFDFDLKKPGGNNQFNEWQYQTNYINLPFQPSPNGKKQQLMVLIDDTPFDLSSNEENKTIKDAIVYSHIQEVFIPKQSAGIHTIELYMTTTVGESSYQTNSIIYQIAWVDDTLKSPLIWFGDYETSIINYNRVRIPYMIYDPDATQSQPSEIHLYHNSVELRESPILKKYQIDDWHYWDVTSIYNADKNVEELLNLFTIQCGITSKTVPLLVTTVGQRDLDLVKPNSLLMNLTSEGRSNSENENFRTNWSYTYDGNIYNTEFFNFNWYNNGWLDDSGTDNTDSQGSYLSIANGASLKIQVPDNITLNGNFDYAFEFRFRVKNIQEYSTLVRLIPKYYVKGREGSYTVEEIIAQNLEYDKDEDGNLRMDPDSPKVLSTTKGIVLKYATLAEDNIGFGIGTQEAYFKTKGDIVSVRYKEDEIINLSFVVSSKSKKLFIYLNGILSGALNLDSVDSFSIDSGYIEINSNYCDFDLYKARIYRSTTEFTMPDVIHNYLSDEKNINLYDENQLTDISDGTNLLYSKLIEYNETHPNELSMPYAIWEIIDNDNSTLDPNNSKHSELDDKLPYYKGNNRWCAVTFVNPSLDKAFSDGVITEDEYLASCPSFYARKVDINVQGTSSQAYPRRNFKTKFKQAGTDKTWWYTHPKLNNRTLKKWHMDNSDCETNKFTWKIDYMESSGTYNTGFANLAGNGLYNYHPLQYYFLGEDGDKYKNYRTSIYGFPCLVFHKHSTPADISRPEDQQYLNYEYIGRYNFNLDKGSDEYYGFSSEDPQPYANNEMIKKVAECWELRDNQGSWTSFKYPDADARITQFETLTEDDTGALEVKKHFQPRYHDEADAIEVAMDLADPDPEKMPYPFDTNSQQEKNEYILAKTQNLKKLFNWLDSTDPTNATNTQLSPEQQLRTTITKYYSIDSFPEVDTNGDYILDVNGDISNKRWFVNKDGKKLLKLDYIQEIPLVDGEFDPNYYISDDEDNQIRIFQSYQNGGCWLENYDPNKENNEYVGLVYSYSGIPYTYEFDNQEYRLAKFKTEFSKHLNKDYCLIYFILTELLLCYDSRGKNMMLATWGPQEEGGEYIWFPIFYDIDTQLGLNNIGAVLWDYDTDATKDGTFSTANSVLWTNFYNAFYLDIESTYRTLRKSGKLTEEKIEGAYLCNPSVFNSYAMRGKRPVIALGLDEWYKYIAPGISSSHWTEGTDRRFGFYVQSVDEGKTKTTDKQYVYTCQGDRKLSRELFIRNRLNYLDSQWLASNYDPSSSGYKSNIMIRANANDSGTSDKYVQRALSAAEINNGYIQVNNIVPHYDAVPEFEITPFLSEYVTVFYDEDPVKPPKKYDKTAPVKTNSTTSVRKGYETAVPYNEQLTYIAGGDYLSDLGDLSLKYPSHFKLITGKRLTQLLLGSDYPNYKNNLLGKGSGTLDLNCSSESQNKKTLLQKIILTGLSGVHENQDVSGCIKLKEYRALGTQIPMTAFAEGSPLETLHLPITTNSLKLTNIKNLTKVLTEKPVIITAEENDGVITYTEADYNSYKGLYIEGLTDYDPEASEDRKNKTFNLLELKDVNLGYDSWIILNNMLKLWDEDGVGAKRKLKLHLENIYWSPYKIIEPGSSYNSEIPYYYLTNHNTFIPYVYDSSTWNLSLLNKKIYTYQANAISETLTDLSFLDNFITSYKTAKANEALPLNYFLSTDPSLAETFSYPTITGTIFVNNSENIINELDLENKYKQYFPYLTIIVNNINEANVLKFVQRNLNGSDEEVDTIRFDKSVTHPDKLTTKKPFKLNYTFEGWSTEPDAESQDDSNIVSIYDEELDEYRLKDNIDLFDINTSEITLYASFSIKKYNVNFYNNETLIMTKQVSHGTSLGNITIKHEQDNNVDINLIDFLNIKAEYRNSSNLAREKRYKLMGWSKGNHYTLVDNEDVENSIINIRTYIIEQDEDFYASYLEQDVRNTASSSAFFDIDSEGTITPKLINKPYFKGKITIPKQINSISVKALNNFKVDDITHIFFEDGFNNNLTIKESCFYLDVSNLKLEYFDPPATLVSIETNGFRNCKYLVPLNLSKVTSKSLKLGKLCFVSSGEAYDTAEKIMNSALNPDFIRDSVNGNYYIQIIPSNVKIGDNSFINMGYFKGNIILQLGTKDNRIESGFFDTAQSGPSYLQFKQNDDKQWGLVRIYPKTDYTQATADFLKEVGEGENYSDKIQEE